MRAAIICCWYMKSYLGSEYKSVSIELFLGVSYSIQFLTLFFQAVSIKKSA